MIFRYAVPLVHIASYILQISSVLCTSVSLVSKKILQIAGYEIKIQFYTIPHNFFI